MKKIILETIFFLYFPDNYSRKVCKSTNKKILALPYGNDAAGFETEEEDFQSNLKWSVNTRN